MRVIKTPIEGLLTGRADVFSDSRGLFFESYTAREFAKQAVDLTFVQDNQSQSSRECLRGLLFRRSPYEQVSWCAW
jgi:dTDP-4-dehydrorhamnose 3,5-epimerase